ncbi:MAG: hypothetical protein QXT45_07030 [Candidatus Bilamarchaeaceae archaeon]
MKCSKIESNVEEIRDRASRGELTLDDVRWLHDHKKEVNLIFRREIAKRRDMSKINRKSKVRPVDVKVEDILEKPLIIIDAAEREGDFGIYLAVKAYLKDKGLVTFIAGGRLMEDLEAEANNMPLACQIVSLPLKNGRKTYRVEDIDDDVYEQLLEDYETFESGG